MEFENLSSLRLMAIKLLAFREHSADELHKKLAKKCAESELIDQTLATLSNDGLQSDERFSQAYTRMRLNQGKGEKRIRMELREKGVADALIESCLAEQAQEEDWNRLALKAYQKKFRLTPIVDMKDRARRIRFLTARGFSPSSIRYAMQQEGFADDTHQ